MSKYSDIKNLYDRFVAAREAADKTKPGKVEIVYKKNDERPCDDGCLIYSPDYEIIRILPRRKEVSNYIDINADDVPALIKALRDFFE